MHDNRFCPRARRPGWCAFAFLVLALAGFGARAAPLAKGAWVTVAQVVDGDTVSIASPIGRASEIRLVGIQAPKLPLGRPGFRKWPLADEARDALLGLTAGRRLRLSYGGRRMDRHGRILAHLHDEKGIWIQGEMLIRGMARVYSFADNRAVIDEMLALERQARAKRRGLWADLFYAVRGQAEAGRFIGGFQLVEGRVLDVTLVRGRAYLNFGANWRTDFSISLNSKALRLFRRAKVDPSAYEGRRIRVRGWIKSYNGPMIGVTHPEQIEVLDR